MQKLKINCLTECLKCNCDTNCCPHNVPNKRGKKYITLVKNCYTIRPFKSTKPNDFLTNDRTSFQQLNLQKKSDLGSRITRIPLTERQSPIDKNQIVWNRYSETQTPHPENAFYTIPKTHRERMSVGASPNTYVKGHSVELMINSARYKERVSSEDEVYRYPLINSLTSSKKKFNQANTIKPIIPIAEQQEKQKRSSFFRGAKKIISKLGSFNNDQKENVAHSLGLLSIKKVQSNRQRFYENIRVCQTLQKISLPPSIMGSNRKMDFQESNQNIDDIVSLKSKQQERYSHFKIGRLLGVGKWTRVHICQQKQSSSIYSIKQIFKVYDQRIQLPVQKIYQTIKSLVNIIHPKIISIFAKFQTIDKICLISEYCNKSLYDYLTENAIIPIKTLKSFLTDLVQGIVFMHENDVIHGNINSFQIFINFNECKIQPSIIHSTLQQNGKLQSFQTDIDSLAILAFQMGYGVTSHIEQKQTRYEKEKLYQEVASKRIIIKHIEQQLSLPNNNPTYHELNSFILMLINWNEGSRLTAGLCLSHPFFQSTYKQ